MSTSTSTSTSTIRFTSRPYTRPSLSPFVCSAQALSLNSRVLSGMYLLYNRCIYYIPNTSIYIPSRICSSFWLLVFCQQNLLLHLFCKIRASKTRRKASETNVISLVFHIFFRCQWYIIRANGQRQSTPSHKSSARLGIKCHFRPTSFQVPAESINHHMWAIFRSWICDWNVCSSSIIITYFAKFVQVLCKY